MHVLFLVFTVRLFCRNLGNPGTSADLFLKSGRNCQGRIARYVPTVNGNLDYFHGETSYVLCIGSKSVKNKKWEPSENEEVSIEEDVCSVNNSCKFDYGKILLILRPSNRQIIVKVKFK